eukprot:7614104-Pyramimonas_sp.AAC.2
MASIVCSSGVACTSLTRPATTRGQKHRGTVLQLQRHHQQCYFLKSPGRVRLGAGASRGKS